MAYEQKKYEESEAVRKAREDLASVSAQKPGAYASEYQPHLKDLAGQILNRKDFTYDLNGDALYNQYKDRYVDLGRQAMMDTIGQASKLTGGYGNSYAQMAGQQAYHGYLQGLNDKVPELYQLAIDRYNQQGQDLYNRYGLLNTQDQQAYDRYRDSYNQWINERGWMADMLNNERGFDYGAHRDAVGDAQWQAGFDEDLRRWNFANQQGEYAPQPVSYGGGSDPGRSPALRDTPQNQEPGSSNDMNEENNRFADKEALFQSWLDKENDPTLMQSPKGMTRLDPSWQGDQNIIRRYYGNMASNVK